MDKPIRVRCGSRLDFRSPRRALPDAGEEQFTLLTVESNKDDGEIVSMKHHDWYR